MTFAFRAQAHARHARLKGGHAMLAAGLLATLSPWSAHAHGMTGRPIARQYQCVKDGGYWAAADGSKIPNPGCRAAYLAVAATDGQQAGVYPFQQYNEVSANPARYEDMASVKQAVPNGLLCAGGDRRKRGLDIPQSQGWAKSVVTPVAGYIDMTWEVTAAHNPSFLRVFLTKPDWTGTRELRWDDLDLIYQGEAPEPDRSTYPNVYRYHIPFPSGRQGNAIVYSIWQRRDAGNEGFFNCSDVTIQGSAPLAFPWVEGKPFVEEAMAPVPGEQIQFRVLGGDATGKEVVNVTLPIDASNQDVAQWSTQLATQINATYGGYVQLGVRSGDAVNWDAAHIYANKVWLKNDGSSSAMRVVAAPVAPTDPGMHPAWPEGLGRFQPGSVVIGLDGQAWQCKALPQGAWCNVAPPSGSDPMAWPYAPGGNATPAAEDQRAWQRAS